MKTPTPSNTTTAARPTAPAVVAAPTPKSPVPKATTPASNEPSTSAPIEIRYVSASTLNIRAEPSTNAAIVSKISNGERVTVLDRASGWVLVQSSAGYGWISERYTSSTRPAQIYTPPATLVQAPPKSSGLSCSPRRTCSQIGSCSAARWYLANCSWGGRLDRDKDGRPCEAMC
ncbi:SH3 domain-containing protein [Devosia epidermidihirudinis]|uniref:SH3 domain-containing protein n=1 Tax=Devosia epidermidihirudinis TaxID=1293439 RepID=UPI00387E08A3